MLSLSKPKSSFAPLRSYRQVMFVKATIRGERTEHSILAASEALTDDLRIKTGLESVTRLPAQPCP